MWMIIASRSGVCELRSVGATDSLSSEGELASIATASVSRRRRRFRNRRIYNNVT